MATDYAKRKQGSSAKKAPARKKTSQRNNKRPSSNTAGGGWRWYASGVLTGFFLSFLFYLGTLPSPGGSSQEQPGEPTAAAEAPKPRFDFYTLLPEQTIDDVDAGTEPDQVTQPRATQKSTSERYLLQAGSFRQRDDADRRRAELLLLGLDPKVEESNGDNGRWHRVFLGPFDSHSKMAKARSLTANQDIDTLLLKRGAP